MSRQGQLKEKEKRWVFRDPVCRKKRKRASVTAFAKRRTRQPSVQRKPAAPKKGEGNLAPSLPAHGRPRKRGKRRHFYSHARQKRKEENLSRIIVRGPKRGGWESEERLFQFSKRKKKKRAFPLVIYCWRREAGRERRQHESNPRPGGEGKEEKVCPLVEVEERSALLSRRGKFAMGKKIGGERKSES